MTTDSLPAKRFRLGSITVTIWPIQDSRGRNLHTTSITRTARDRTGRWCDDAPIRQADIPVVRTLTAQAEEWLSRQAVPSPLAALSTHVGRNR